MIRAGFLSTTERAELIELARDGLVARRPARRADALVLLDRGMSCSEIGAVLFLDDDTVRTWFSERHSLSIKTLSMHPAAVRGDLDAGHRRARS